MREVTRVADWLTGLALSKDLKNAPRVSVILGEGGGGGIGAFEIFFFFGINVRCRTEETNPSTTCLPTFFIRPISLPQSLLFSQGQQAYLLGVVLTLAQTYNVSCTCADTLIRMDICGNSLESLASMCAFVSPDHRFQTYSHSQTRL